MYTVDSQNVRAKLEILLHQRVFYVVEISEIVRTVVRIPNTEQKLSIVKSGGITLDSSVFRG